MIKIFEEFEEKNKYNINRAPPVDLSNFILVEKREIDEFKCGECDGTIFMSIYYCSSPKKFLKQFKCSNCNLETWR